MKKVCKLVLMALVFVSAFTVSSQENSKDRNYFQLSPRLGYDIPTYNNNTPYIDYKGGMDLGLSIDYYWTWFGLGFDFDYIKNKPESTYPTNLGSLTTSLTEDKITRFFFGIGPNVQFRSKTRKFKTEINTRLGLASIKGGRTLLEDSSLNMLNFHAGYDESSVLSFKGQVRFTYLLNDNFGINAGAYYLKHFGVKELSEGGISSGYQPFTENAGEIFINQGEPMLREEPCDCDISSVGLFAGVTYKFSKKENLCEVCGEDHYPHCCATCGCGVTITTKDKFTGDTLPHTDIALTDLNGNIVQNGTTNSFGVVVFNDVKEDDYLVRGKLYNITLEETSISKAEFKDCKKSSSGIQKVILYSDSNFILKGNVVECNTDGGIQGVDIVLKDKIKAGQKNTLSDADGNFIFHLKQVSTYALKGNKDGYFSNEVEVSTSAYNRNTSLFIDFEMCIDPCGKAIRLDNINFNLAKWDILPAARPELDYVVKLMQDNPGIKVEMSSHTDSRGGNDYNLDLSQKRAQSTVDYLVLKGIASDRLIPRGAGESELLNRCDDGVSCTEKEHTINRRTEFKVVCPQ